MLGSRFTGARRAARSANYLERLRVSAAALSSPELAASAIVFAPHQDDESLGCGGTILKKAAAGARVLLAFMTDGSAMLRDELARRELSELRRREALKAAEILGLDAQATRFLDFRDGSLSKNQDAAIERVLALLRLERPAQVFVPILGDGHPDHIATRTIVLKALTAWAEPVTVFEYPVWFWFTSPHVAPPELTLDLRGVRQRAWWAARAAAKWLWAQRYLRSKVEFADLVERKRAAIAVHESQQSMLNDVGAGEFRAIFERPFELFRKTRR